MAFSSWTTKELMTLCRLRDEGQTFSAISKILKKSKGSTALKYNRMNWEAFLEDPDNYDKVVPRSWTKEEMYHLDAYIQADKSYAFIADKLNRSITSVERQAQSTDWAAWSKIKDVDTSDGVEISQEARDILIDTVVDAYLAVVRHDADRLKHLTEKEFLKRVNMDKDKLPISFPELKVKADEALEKLGFKNPEDIVLGKGTYVIVGDSHGKHTKKSMFELLRKVNSHLKPDKIIHVGHILDDDSDISYEWGTFKNLIILSKIEELKFVQDQRNKFKFNYDIVRGSINFGDLVLMNQDMISDYVKTPISGLDSQIFDPKVIVNCHRHEFFTRTANEAVSYIASPGCLCEKHIIKTIKQIDFNDGKVVKQAYWAGFTKYRRMKHMYQYWEQGLLVLHVDDKGNLTIVPCRIQNTAKGYATSYFDKIITPKGVFNPEKKIFVNADMHCCNHDTSVLDVQEQVCKDYKPDACVNLGDTHNYAALNHHAMDRGQPILDHKVITEATQTHFVLKRVAQWSKENHLIYGNHERFARDFIKKYPQFEGYLDFPFLCAIDSLGYELTNLKDILKIGSARFIHGDITMYGQPGSKIEKASRTFGNNVFVGHIHYPAIRFGCYSVGLTGLMDQEYNEPTASRWVHGFGLCNQFHGKSWLTTVAITDNVCLMGKKRYVPSKNAAKSWKTPACNVHLVYDVK